VSRAPNGVFCNPDVLPESWYLVARSGEVRRGRVVSRPLLDRTVALWRDASGRVRALGGRCPHLGADLGRGDLDAEGCLRCPFHRWRYAPDGRCLEAPGLPEPPPFARSFAYPTVERWGGVWVWNGPAPAFPLPWFDTQLGRRLRAVRLPPVEIGQHPHLIASNGLDVQHFTTVHRLAYASEPVLEEPDPFRVRLRLDVRLRGHDAFEKALRLVAGERVRAAFTTWGGNLATIDGRAGPIPILVLFSHRPLPGGRSASQTFLLLPRGGPAARVAGGLALAAARAIMGHVRASDRAVIDGLRFRRRLVATDAPLAAFIRQVERRPAFDPEDVAVAAE